MPIQTSAGASFPHASLPSRWLLKQIGKNGITTGRVPIIIVETGAPVRWNGTGKAEVIDKVAHHGEHQGGKPVATRQLTQTHASQPGNGQRKGPPHNTTNNIPISKQMDRFCDRGREFTSRLYGNSKVQQQPPYAWRRYCPARRQQRQMKPHDNDVDDDTLAHTTATINLQLFPTQYRSLFFPRRQRLPSLVSRPKYCRLRSHRRHRRCHRHAGTMRPHLCRPANARDSRQCAAGHGTGHAPADTSRADAAVVDADSAHIADAQNADAKRDMPVIRQGRCVPPRRSRPERCRMTRNVSPHTSLKQRQRRTHTVATPYSCRSRPALWSKTELSPSTRHDRRRHRFSHAKSTRSIRATASNNPQPTVDSVAAQCQP